jgi:hypothetical protein
MHAFQAIIIIGIERVLNLLTKEKIMGIGPDNVHIYMGFAMGSPHNVLLMFSQF